MNARNSAIVFFGVMFGFKIWSIILIYWVGGSDGTTTFLLGTHVLWIALPLAILLGPSIFWIRAIRVRRRRQQLLDAEFHVNQPPSIRR